jgi:hypothetical protein
MPNLRLNFPWKEDSHIGFVTPEKNDQAWECGTEDTWNVGKNQPEVISVEKVVTLLELG